MLNIIHIESSSYHCFAMGPKQQNRFCIYKTCGLILRARVLYIRIKCKSANMTFAAEFIGWAERPMFYLLYLFIALCCPCKPTQRQWQPLVHKLYSFGRGHYAAIVAVVAIAVAACHRGRRPLAPHHPFSSIQYASACVCPPQNIDRIIYYCTYSSSKQLYWPFQTTNP